MRISDWSSDVCSSDLLEPKRPLDRTDNLAADNGIKRTRSLRRQSLRVDAQAFEREILRYARAALVVDDFKKVALDAAVSRRMDDLQDRFQPIVEAGRAAVRSEEHTSELQSLMRISYAVFCLNKKT